MNAGTPPGPPAVTPFVHAPGMETPDHRLAALARAQHGVIGRQQARGCGLSDKQLRARVARGHLEVLGPNSFRVAGSPPDPRGRVLALLLDVGHDARACGPTAAALHGFDGFVLRPPFHVLIPHRVGTTRPGHRVHTTTELPLIDRATVGRIPVTAGARTVIDLARSEPTDRLTLALDSGLRDGRFNESLLHRRIVALRGSGRNGIRRLLDVIDGCEVARGGHSWLEREFLRLMADAGLPRPETQVVLARTGTRSVRVDARFPGTPVVVELLGYRFHRTPAQLRGDSERLNALLLDGFVPLQFTYDQVVERPEFVIRDVDRAVRVRSVA